MVHQGTRDSRIDEKLLNVAQHVHSRIKNVHPYAPDGRKDQSYPPPPPDKPEQKQTTPLDVALRHGDVRAHCDEGFVYEEDGHICCKSLNGLIIIRFFIRLIKSTYKYMKNTKKHSTNIQVT